MHLASKANPGRICGRMRALFAEFFDFQILTCLFRHALFHFLFFLQIAEFVGWLKRSKESGNNMPLSRRYSSCPGGFSEKVDDYIMPFCRTSLFPLAETCLLYLQRVHQAFSGNMCNVWQRWQRKSSKTSRPIDSYSPGLPFSSHTRCSPLLLLLVQNDHDQRGEISDSPTSTDTQ